MARQRPRPAASGAARAGRLVLPGDPEQPTLRRRSRGCPALLRLGGVGRPPVRVYQLGRRPSRRWWRLGLWPSAQAVGLHLAAAVAERGMTVVSGGAFGIDVGRTSSARRRRFRRPTGSLRSRALLASYGHPRGHAGPFRPPWRRAGPGSEARAPTSSRRGRGFLDPELRSSRPWAAAPSWWKPRCAAAPSPRARHAPRARSGCSDGGAAQGDLVGQRAVTSRIRDGGYVRHRRGRRA